MSSLAVVARHATSEDIATLVSLYRDLEQEMADLRPVWPYVDGVPEPAENAFALMIHADDWHVYVGEIDGQPLGFLAARDEPLLPQAGGATVGAIRYIYSEPEARRVGLGEALTNLFLTEARSRGIARFDAHVSPGHLDAKNFFESNGFKARAIVMYTEDGA